MEIIFITPRYDGDNFDSYLGASIQKIKTKCVNVADSKDSTHIKTISNKYNIGIDIIKQQNILTDSTIVVFAKPNVHIIDPIFADKISMIFSDTHNVGVVGVAGVKELHTGRNLYSNDNTPLNGIIYTTDKENNKGEHVQYSKTGFYTDAVAVDDSIIAVRGSLLLNDDFSFEYDSSIGFGIELSIKAIKYGYDVAVADILVVSENKSNIDYEIIDNIVSLSESTYPVNVKTLGKNINSVIDIEL